MDIANIRAKTRPIEITHPGNGQLLGIRVHLRPMSHDAVQAEIRQQRDDAIAAKGQITDQARAKNTTKLLGAAIESWEWYGEDAVYKGQKPEDKVEAYREVLSELEWMRKQLDVELGNAREFYRD